jgi:hypothetical protein
LKIFVEGREYKAVPPHQAELIHLMELRQQTRVVVPGGFGMQGIKDLATRVEDARKAGQDPDEDDSLLFMAVMVFLARRHAGESISFTEACSFPLEALRIEQEPHEVEAAEQSDGGRREPDPTRAVGDGSSGNGDVVEWRRPARKKTPAKATAKAKPPAKRAASR